MGKKPLLALVLGAALAVLCTVSAFAGGNQEKGSSAASSNVQVSFALSEDPKTLDPTLSYSAPDVPVIQAMFLPLIYWNESTGRPEPALATSWDISSDGLTYTFHLRQGVVWSNGNPVTAQDVVAGMQRIVDPKTGSPFANRLYLIKNAEAINSGKADPKTLGVAAPDASTVVITLAAPAAFFMADTGISCYAIPSSVVAQYGNAWTDPANIAVDGPYTLKSWDHQNEIVLVKNPRYVDAANVQIDTFHVLIVTDESTAVDLYQTGKLDTVSIGSGDIDRVTADPTLSKELHNGALQAAYRIQFQTHTAPMDNANLRKALAAAIDKNQLVKYVLRGGQIPAQTWTPPGVFGFVPASAGIGIPYDPAKAKQYLAQAGYPDGKGLPQISLTFGSSQTNSKIAQALQQMWQQNLGISVQLNSMEPRSSFQSLSGGQGYMGIMGWGADYPDADDFLYLIFDSHSGEEMHSWTNAQFDQDVEKARLVTDPSQREALYKDAETLLVQTDTSIVPLYWGAYNILTKPYLHRDYSAMQMEKIWTWRVEK